MESVVLLVMTHDYAYFDRNQYYDFVHSKAGGELKLEALLHLYFGIS